MEILTVIVKVGALMLVGGSDAGTQSVMGLGTAQRNLSAAMVVAAQNFSDKPNVLLTVIVAGIIGLVLLMPIAGELGKRMSSSGSSAEAPPSTT